MFLLPTDAVYFSRVKSAVGKDQNVRWYRGLVSSVSIATCYVLEDVGIESRWGVKFFASVQNSPGAHTASYTIGTVSFPGG